MLTISTAACAGADEAQGQAYGAPEVIVSFPSPVLNVCLICPILLYRSLQNHESTYSLAYLLALLSALAVRYPFWLCSTNDVIWSFSTIPCLFFDVHISRCFCARELAVCNISSWGHCLNIILCRLPVGSREASACTNFLFRIQGTYEPRERERGLCITAGIIRYMRTETGNGYCCETDNILQTHCPSISKLQGTRKQDARAKQPPALS